MSDVHDAVLEAVHAIAAGRMVIVVDDHDRENEADLVVAAEAITPAVVNFMITHARGLVCAPMEGSRLGVLGLPDMVQGGNDPFGTRFAVGVDLNTPGCTGISAAARAATIAALADPATSSHDLRTPGHIFPLRYADGGVLTRRGHTEASVDLARLAGMRPAAAICEILSGDGTMLRDREVAAFAASHRLPVVTIDQIVAYRCATEAPLLSIVPPPAGPRVTRVAETRLPTRYGTWRLIGYADNETGEEHAALVMGDLSAMRTPLVRLHSECLTGDVLNSERCDCGRQLESSFEAISRAGSGVIVYIAGHEGRGIGLLNKLRAYALQDDGWDTVDANLILGMPGDARNFDQGTAILEDLGLTQVRLLTNNPDKVTAVIRQGIEVVECVLLGTAVTANNAAYLGAKRWRMGHWLWGVDDVSHDRPLAGGSK
jgi:3,4-dihydroxy 2-butanone 4-phosphate synthase / GTP cyclohydrolase II